MIDKDKELIEVPTAEVVVVQPGKRMPVTQKEVDEVVRIAELQVDLRNRLLGVLVKTTSPKNWVDLGGNPYLAKGGCEAFAATIGISYEILKPERRMSDDEVGAFYIYETIGTFIYRGVSITAMGMATSRDQFFAKAHGEWRPQSEINEANISKKAYTNCFNNGIKKSLGLSSLTWADLEAVGMNPNDIAAVQYGAEPAKKPAPSGQKPSAKPASSNGDDKTPDEYRKLTGEMILEIVEGDMLRAQDELEMITAWENKDGKHIKGKRSVKDISDKAAPVVFRQTEKRYKEWKK